jgi:NB-ARC domain
MEQGLRNSNACIIFVGSEGIGPWHRQEMQVAIDRGAREPDFSVIPALRGAGGFGKTALAQKLCFDERVREAYPDGIVWVTMGEDLTETGRLSRIRDLIRGWTEKEAPAFETVDGAGTALRNLLAGRRVLLVIDDAWSSLNVNPLKGLDSGSALLITTRIAARSIG